MNNNILYIIITYHSKTLELNKLHVLTQRWNWSKIVWEINRAEEQASRDPNLKMRNWN